MRAIAIATAILCFVFAITACSPNGKPMEHGDAAARRIFDPAGRTVEIPREVKRVVCIGPGALRYAVYAGGTDKIAGVEHGEGGTNPAKCFSYARREIFSKLPVIGRNGVPNEEAITSLAPDVIITTNSSAAADAMQRKTGIPVVAIPIPEGAFDAETHMALKTVGEILGTQDRCESLSEYIRELEKDLKTRTKDIPESDRPSVYVGAISFKGAHGFEGTHGAYPPFDAVGAANVADSTGRKGSFDVDIEHVIKWDPKYIFLEAGNISLVEALFKKRPEILQMLTAVREGRVYSNVAFRFGATNTEMAIANAYYIGSVLYPDKFSDINIECKTDEITTRFLGVPLYGELKKAGYEFKKIKLGKSPNASENF